MLAALLRGTCISLTESVFSASSEGQLHYLHDTHPSRAFTPAEDRTVTDSSSVPVSVRLLSRRSVVGGSVVLAVALFYILALPIIDNSVEGENPFRPGEPFVVADSYSIVPQPGWDLESEAEIFTTLKKGESTLVLVAAVSQEQSPEEAIDLTVTAFENDETTTWVIGDPQTFVTNAGDHGVKLVAHSTNDASETWVIANGEMSTTLVATTPDNVWASVADELDAIASSVVILDEESGE